MHRLPHGDECLGAMDQGAELSALICGAEPGATEAATFAHVGRESYNLGAEIHGAETCYLGTMVHDAKLEVHFLKSFKKECSRENLSTKGPENKKDGQLAIKV
jgi:hypothetical protein